MAHRLENGILEWADEMDQYVVLVSRRVRCSEEELDQVMQRVVGVQEATGGSSSRIDEDELAGELSDRLKQKVWVSKWQNPTAMMEYYVELEGQPVDWMWLD